VFKPQAFEQSFLISVLTADLYFRNFRLVFQCH